MATPHNCVCDHGCGASDTVTEPGSRIPLYRVVDAEGRNIASQESLEGGTLTITADRENAPPSPAG